MLVKNTGQEKHIESLKASGVNVRAFGGRWAEGRVNHQRMLEIFSFSKINLNFSETYFYGAKEKFKMLAKLFVGKELGHYKFTGHHFFDNLKAMQGTQRNPIKGRVFEVPACGGFVLTGKSNDDISEYYVPGKEIVEFNDTNDLIEKAKYYLEHEDERKAIAKAGYDRTIKDHTYQKRFADIFSKMGLM